MKKLMLTALLVMLCVPQVGFSQDEEKEKLTLKQKADVVSSGVLGGLAIGCISYVTYFFTEGLFRCARSAEYVACKMEEKWPSEIKNELIALALEPQQIKAVNKVINYDFAKTLLNRDFCKKVNYYNWKDHQKGLYDLRTILALGGVACFFGGIYMGMDLFCKVIIEIKHKLSYYRKKNKEEVTT